MSESRLKSAGKSRRSARRRAAVNAISASKPGERAVLTTGANSGFGLACALEVARRGYRSIGTVRSTQKANLVEEAAEAAGVEVETVILDVTDAEACQQALLDVQLFALINNAGFSVVGAVEDVDDQIARDAFEAMVIAPMRLARLALPGMRERGVGRIICMSSMYARATTAFNGWYQAAKHALEGVSDALRVEVARDGIDVILVEPGVFKTNIFDDANRSVATYRGSRYRNAYRRASRLAEPVERYAPSPEHVARLIGRILDARAPRSRYLIGADAYVLVASEMLVPTPIKDRLLRLAWGL